jgi:hypothetical protein
MTLTPDQDEVLSAAIAGVPRVIELIATVPAEERGRARRCSGAGVGPGLNLIIRQPLASASASLRLTSKLLEAFT